jgi:hypothetical protein
VWALLLEHPQQLAVVRYGAATPLACSRRSLGSKRPVQVPGGSSASLIPRRICNPEGQAERGIAAWVSLPCLAPPPSFLVLLCARGPCFFFVCCAVLGRRVRLGWWCPSSFAMALLWFCYFVLLVGLLLLMRPCLLVNV